MADTEDLRRQLLDLDGRNYRAYKSLGDSYDFDGFTFRIDHVQGDPFADASRVRALVPSPTAGLPAEVLETLERRVSVADYLNRRLHEALEARSADLGSGRSGSLSILRPGQEVLRRTAFFVHPDGSLEARFRAGLPANGRRIRGRAAAELLCEAMPAAIRSALFEANVDRADLLHHMKVVEDAQALRAQLAEHRLVAFVADGAILPRRSGVDDHPLPAGAAVPFAAPDDLRVTLRAPHAGEVTGLGVPEGVTLLVGGGFHGKSTLLRAIERGVYDHLPGDGRERVVTWADAVKVRAEDGRAVAGTDISNFIDGLPGGEETRRFTTANASGSTSQAAAIAEALEVGCRCLLLDEDTSATNFLIRDARVQSLISDEDEPITPFIDRVDDLRARGTSVVIVVGGSGDYFDVADTVIAMRAYRPRNVSGEARRVAEALPSARSAEGADWHEPAPRAPDPDSIDPRRGRRPVEVKVYGPRRMSFGGEEVDLAAVEQLVEAGQTRAIGRALAWAKQTTIDGRATMGESMAETVRRLAEEGLDQIDDRCTGEYSEFRVFELAAVLNRLRGLRTR